MRLFWELVLRSFQRQLSYRAATLAGLVTNFFFGLVRAAVLVALYGSVSEVESISIQGAITFTGLTQAVIGFLSLFSWYDLMNTVYTGAIASDLLKPMGYYNFWLAQDFGRAIAQLIMRGLPLMVAYALFLGIVLPSNAHQWLALSVAMLFAWLVSFSWRFLINLSAFWIPNALGIGRFAFILSWFLSGFLMPLRFYPDWFIRLCNLTPFPHSVNTVIEVYLGLLNGKDLIWAFLGQMVWIAILFVLGQLVLRAGVRRLVILGG